MKYLYDDNDGLIGLISGKLDQYTPIWTVTNTTLRWSVFSWPRINTDFGKRVFFPIKLLRFETIFLCQLNIALPFNL